MEKRIPETLIELLQDYIIEIPRIQRDYVQGNSDEETKIIRNKLLKDIKESVESVNLDNEGVRNSTFSQLDLNFVYGKRQGEKFIPLDGQQRLTTLYLLYLYAYAMDSLSQADVDKDNEEKDTELFLRFTYDTRISSRQFFECIAKNRKEIFASDNKPSYEIKDSSWFLDGWKYDPTINSALVMLDEITDNFKEVKRLKERLNNKKEKPLVFQFKDIDELGMEDSLYIKLNARGKILSPFENFKSQLIGRIEKINFNKTEDEEKRLKEEIKLDFDGKWTDCIWKLKRIKTNDMATGVEDKFDEIFLRLFEIILMNKKIVTSDNKNIWWGREDVYKAIDEEVVIDIKYILDFMCKYINIVTNCANTNNVVSKEEQNIQTLLGYFIEPICKKESITYIDRLYFYSAMIYIHKCDGYPETKDSTIKYANIKSMGDITESKEGDLVSWIRIIKNLIENTQLDRDDLFESALKQLDVFANEYKDLTGYIASFYIDMSKINSNIGANKIDDNTNNTVNISGFNTEQIKEEIIKAAIIVNGRETGRQTFTKAIYEAESNRYFRGQIRAALYRAKNQTSAVNCVCGYDEVVFNTQWKKIDMLFSNNVARQEDYYNQIRRALLTFGDYRLQVNNYYYTLCISDNNEHSRTPSFRSLFSEFDKMQNGNRVVNNFLAALNIKNGIPIENQLKNIIQTNSVNIAQNDWRYCIINYPDNIIKMNRQHLRMREANNVWYMIPGKMSNGYNYDLYLNTLILAIRKSIHWVEEDWRGYYGTDTEKYICLYNKEKRCYMYVSTEYSATRGYYYRIIDTIDEYEKKSIIMETKTSDLITEMISYLKKII